MARLLTVVLVAGVADAVAVAVRLVGVGDVRAVVDGVLHTLAVDGLDRARLLLVRRFADPEHPDADQDQHRHRHEPLRIELHRTPLF